MADPAGLPSDIIVSQSGDEFRCGHRCPAPDVGLAPVTSWLPELEAAAHPGAC
ncbi:hypothetical protein BD414DRAFT_473401 [Trametes punicea]|nr:hypothetical protein BD414DRAFT_473401 [Trametes punicea]